MLYFRLGSCILHPAALLQDLLSAFVIFFFWTVLYYFFLINILNLSGASWSNILNYKKILTFSIHGPLINPFPDAKVHPLTVTLSFSYPLPSSFLQAYH